MRKTGCCTMLIEILCDEFQDKKGPRGRISLHGGLNCVVGTDDAKNSIGKSTFLMALDFVFGGKDYCEKLKDVMDEVGHHRVCFAFDFGLPCGPLYFSRKTYSPNEVHVCAPDYSEVEKITVESYCKRIASYYHLPSDISLRGAVSRSFRIYKRDTLNVTRPLQETSRQTTGDEIIGLLKIFGVYSDILAAEKDMKEADNKKTAFSSSTDYGYIVAAAKKGEIEDNEKEIRRLEERAEELHKQMDDGVADLDSIAINRLAPLKEELARCNEARTSLETEIRAIRARQSNEYGNKRSDYEALLEFFPDVDIEKIQTIESFHKGLCKILDKECNFQVKGYQELLAQVVDQIKRISTEISSVVKESNCSRAVLDEYSSIKLRIDALRKANANYEKKVHLQEESKRMQQRYNDMVISKTNEIQESINNEMANICSGMTAERRTTPVLTIKDSSHYSFVTPKDGGTGTDDKGLIVFDLAMLSLTKLPAVVHDSVLLKQIEDATIEGIFRLYDKQKKQVFVAIDKIGAYSSETQEIINRNRVLSLGPNGDELFGRSWAVESDSE